MFDPKLKHAIPHYCCASWIKPLYRGRYVNKAKNYWICVPNLRYVY